MTVDKRPGRLIGYARVSTLEQNLDMQIEALNRAGCKPIHIEKVSAARPRRPVSNGRSKASGPETRSSSGGSTASAATFARSTARSTRSKRWVPVCIRSLKTWTPIAHMVLSH